MKVTITSGAYGWRPFGDSRVKTVRSGQSCDVPQDEANRLVGLNVAKYAATETVATPPVPPGDNAGGNDTPDQDNGPVTLKNGVVVPDTLGIVDGHFVAEDLAQMTNPNLSKLATDLGLDIKACKVKADFVALLAAVELEIATPDDEDDTVDDGETPPDVQPEGPVS